MATADDAGAEADVDENSEEEGDHGEDEDADHANGGGPAFVMDVHGIKSALACESTSLPNDCASSSSSSASSLLSSEDDGDDDAARPVIIKTKHEVLIEVSSYLGCIYF